ncbi:MAG: DUF5357 domain-containing protein [Symploca sp. SIO2E9]|nr:DUF5357 domain-containing protein [Symploca sp. SIO2E9]
MKLFRDLLKFIAGIFIVKWVVETFRPPHAFSWQTLFWLSVFSYFMSLLATDFVRVLLQGFGWIFIILMVYWWTSSIKELRIGQTYFAPWITGILVSIYIFELSGRNKGEISPEVLIFWPLISAVIAAIPNFLGEELQFKAPSPEKRQNLVVLFSSQLLLTSWFQFAFLIQNWTLQYPSILTDDFSKSAFVINVESLPSDPPRGALILNTMKTKLEEKLKDKNWSEVERLLLEVERKKWLPEITEEAKKQISSEEIKEDKLWELTYDIKKQGSGYNLEILAAWDGPRSQPQKYSLKQSCQIDQVYPQNDAATKSIGKIECKPLQGWGIDSPIIS